MSGRRRRTRALAGKYAEKDVEEMDHFDFDKVTDRRGTSCLKYDFAVERGKPADVLPLWVADMDFPAPPAVQQALQKAVQHNIYGYTEAGPGYTQAVLQWFATRHHLHAQPQWLVKTPGVVFALAAAVRAFTEPGDSVLIQRPVYYPFTKVIEENGRRLINSPLQLREGRYEIDFADFAQKITEHHVRLFILCNPHNPVGRVWSKEELQRMGQICLAHGVTVVADEIHADFTYPGHQHHSFLTVDSRFQENSLVCTAPSKTFNLAGLQASNIFIPHAPLRQRFLRTVSAAGYSQLNSMAVFACEAAYRGGAQWLDELKVYLQGNLDYLRDFVRARLPGISLVEPQGTYLVWLDCRGLQLGHDQLEDLMVHKAKLWLDSGFVFGEEGEGFERVNIACPRCTLQAALERLEAAVRSL